MPARKKAEPTFVLTSNGTSAHRHGAFLNPDVARKWIAAHYANWPCYLVPAEYAGRIPMRLLDEDGQLVNVE